MSETIGKPILPVFYDVKLVYSYFFLYILSSGKCKYQFQHCCGWPLIKISLEMLKGYKETLLWKWEELVQSYSCHVILSARGSHEVVQRVLKLRAGMFWLFHWWLALLISLTHTVTHHQLIAIQTDHIFMQSTPGYTHHSVVLILIQFHWWSNQFYSIHAKQEFYSFFPSQSATLLHVEKWKPFSP